MNKGLFITFEGPDGSGKTSVSLLVHQALVNHGIDAIYSREPGGSRLAEKIRELILDPENTEMDSRAEALLYAASRRQNVVENILPALKQGKTVVCDRFIDSSLAYQGFGRKLGMEAVYAINQFAVESCMPDLTYFLDVDFNVGLERVAKNRTFIDRLELEKSSFHRDVYEGYRVVRERFKERMVVVDANQPIETSVQWIVADILKRMNG